MFLPWIQLKDLEKVDRKMAEFKKALSSHYREEDIMYTRAKKIKSTTKAKNHSHPAGWLRFLAGTLCLIAAKKH